MAVPEQAPYKEYTANGSTTSFALGFICDSKNDLIVLVDGVAPPVATWSLIGANAVFTTAPASGKKIVLQRNTAMSRTTNYQSNNNSFRPETINKDIDRVWLKLQELGVADMLLKIYADRLHGEQKDYIDNKDQLVRNIIADLRNYVNQQDNNRNSYFENLIGRQGVSLQQLQNYWKSLFNQMANLSSEKNWVTSLIVDSDTGLTQREINSYVVFPEFFGAVGGDAEKDTKAFQDAVAAGAALSLVSNRDYHIKCDNFLVGENKNLIVYGNSNSKITLFPGSTDPGLVFDISNANKILIDGVDFTTSDGALRRLFTVSPESYIQHFELTNNDFQNGALLIRGAGSTTRNPESHPYGFKKFVFNNNTGKNVIGGFSILTDYPVYTGEIRGNEFTNFRNVFFNFSKTNESQNGAAINKITDITLDSNTWKSDDDFWANDISGLYYTPLIIEGNRVVWTNNRVSGLKTENNVSVFDAYLACQNVTSAGNTTKNIGSFHIDNDSNAIFHGKADRSPGFDAPIKTFTDNQFVIEKSWLARIGKTSIKHRLFNLGVINSGNVTIRGNTINADTIRPSHVNRFERFEWSDNPINARNNSDANFLQVGPALDSGCSAYIRNFEATLEAAQSQLCLMRPINNTMFWDVLEITNLTINAPTSTLTNNALLSGVKAKKASVFGVRYNAPIHIEYTTGCQFKELYADNNIYHSTRSGGAWIGRYRDIFGASNVKDTFIGLVNLHYIRVYSSLTEPPTKLSQRFTVNADIEWGLSSESFSFSYVLEYVPASNKYIVKFINESDEEIVADVNSGQSHNVTIKVDKPEGSTFGARLRNLESETYFEVLNIPQEHCRYTAQVISF